MQLDFTGPLQDEHAQEGIGDGAAHGEQAMVTQDHEVGVAQVGLQARFFIVAQGHAFVVVVGQAGQREQALLRQGQQTFLLGGHGDAGGGVGVHDAGGIVAHRVDGAVDGETGRVDVVIAVVELVTFLIHPHQAGGGDLVEHHAVGVDQEMMLVAGDAGGKVGKDKIIPAVQGNEPVGGGEIHAQLPFFGADGVFGGDGSWVKSDLAVHVALSRYVGLILGCAPYDGYRFPIP